MYYVCIVLTTRWESKVVTFLQAQQQVNRHSYQTHCPSTRQHKHPLKCKKTIALDQKPQFTMNTMHMS